jgi:hypothetical protein
MSLVFMFLPLVIALPLLAAAGIGARMLSGQKGDAGAYRIRSLDRKRQRGAALSAHLVSRASSLPAWCSWWQDYAAFLAHLFYRGPPTIGFILHVVLLAGMCHQLAGADLSAGNWSLGSTAIGYDTERTTATGNAPFFVTNRIGDAGFILGLALAMLWIGNTSWSGLAETAMQGGLDKVSARMLLLGFVIAAIAKSAQLPLSGWLARALGADVVCHFYGAIAGCTRLMLIRLEPVLRQCRTHVTGCRGLVTALMAVAGLTQRM